MSARQYQITYKEKGTRGPLLQKTFDGDERLGVRELTSRELISIRPCETSLYRHALVLDGVTYDIMGVFELKGTPSGANAAVRQRDGVSEGVGQNRDRLRA